MKHFDHTKYNLSPTTGADNYKAQKLMDNLYNASYIILSERRSRNGRPRQVIHLNPESWDQFIAYFISTCGYTYVTTIVSNLKAQFNILYIVGDTKNEE